ncbi:hypothetical protein ASG39_14705 [Rhizobium sp. Leaf371]|uniref:hypothetical protein n=1 Tax=Rhizobium sp. Leaf371 TaxID=1736355 RepID=UPI000714DB0A|nr:hypothetical protein [Rhizobium sp. Leaf371]KQS63175.1 hypothetical protein ASG39_14705 [Rhizobium sp. Leaf371]
MNRKDHLQTAEQAKPDDVQPTADDTVARETPSIAPTFVKPEEVADESNRPVVNPVTGGAF